MPAIRGHPPFGDPRDVPANHAASARSHVPRASSFATSVTAVKSLAISVLPRARGRAVECSATGDYQIRQPPRPTNRDRTRLVVAAASAGQRPDTMVPPTRRDDPRPDATGHTRGVGPQTDRRLMALSE